MWARYLVLLLLRADVSITKCTDPTYSTCYPIWNQIDRAAEPADPSKPLAAGDVVSFKVSYLLGGKGNSVASKQTTFVANFWFGSEVQQHPPQCTITAFQGLQCALGPTAVNNTVTLLFSVKVPAGVEKPQFLPFSYQIWDAQADVPPGQPHEWGDTRTEGALRIGSSADPPTPPPPPPPSPPLAFVPLMTGPSTGVWQPAATIAYNLTIGIGRNSTAAGAKNAKLQWSGWSGGVVTVIDPRCKVNTAMELRCLLGAIPTGGSTTVMLNVTLPRTLTFPFGLPFTGGVWESSDAYGPCDDYQFWFCPRMTEFFGMGVYNPPTAAVTTVEV